MKAEEKQGKDEREGIFTSSLLDLQTHTKFYLMASTLQITRDIRVLCILPQESIQIDLYCKEKITKKQKNCTKNKSHINI